MADWLGSPTIVVTLAAVAAQGRAVASPATEREHTDGDGTMASGVVLRDVMDGDLPIFFDHQLDPVATRMAAFPARDRKTFMAHWSRIVRDETIVKRTILVDGRVAGNIVCWVEGGDPLVGYWLGREFWGKGAATAALAAFLGHVAARPLYARVSAGNVGSVRVLEKCGFTRLWQEPIARLDGDVVEEAVYFLRPG